MFRGSIFMKDSIYPTYEVTPRFNLSQYRCNVTFLSMCFYLVRDISSSGVSSKLDFIERAKVQKLRHQENLYWINTRQSLNDQLIISSWVSMRMLRYWACGKFGEHEKGVIIIIIIISLLNPLVVYNTKLQGRSRIRRTHNYTWQEGKNN